jgi:hypothetical protein
VKRYKLPSRQQKRLKDVDQYLESLLEVDDGLLLTCKRNMSSSDWNHLVWNFLIAGVDFKLHTESRTFLIPKEYFIRETLHTLITIFHTSQSEIREHMKFLVREGVSVERIQNETGASRATIYRYIKEADQSVEAEGQPDGT